MITYNWQLLNNNCQLLNNNCQLASNMISRATHKQTFLQFIPTTTTYNKTINIVIFGSVLRFAMAASSDAAYQVCKLWVGNLLHGTTAAALRLCLERAGAHEIAEIYVRHASELQDSFAFVEFCTPEVSRLCSQCCCTF